MHYKEGQVFLQNRISGITSQGRCCISGNFYWKVGQLLQSTKGKQEKRGKTINFDNLVPYLPLICLAADNLHLRIFKKMNHCQNQRKKEIPHHHSRICETCKSEKQLLREMITLTLQKSLENYSLLRVIVFIRVIIIASQIYSLSLNSGPAQVQTLLAAY